jgi:hypothetical protein
LTVDGSIAAQVSRIADGVSKLVSQHIALAKLELAEDAKAVGISVGLIAGLAPFILVGYLFLCGAAAVGMSAKLGLSWSLAIVGGVNALGGLAGILVAVQKLRTRHMFGGTIQEVQKSASELLGVSPQAPALPSAPPNGAGRIDAR